MNSYLLEQIKLHPSMQMQDIVKFCYQSAYGAEHLLIDTKKAQQYFNEEYDNTEPRDIPLYEEISNTLCRVNFAAWKYQQRSKEELFQLFVTSAGNLQHNDELFIHLLDEAINTIPYADIYFTPEEFQSYIHSYLSDGIRAIHHSDLYRTCETPHYRLVRTDILTFSFSQN